MQGGGVGTVMPFQSKPVVPGMMLLFGAPAANSGLGNKGMKSLCKVEKREQCSDGEVLSLLLFLLIWGCHTRTLT